MRRRHHHDRLVTNDVDLIPAEELIDEQVIGDHIRVVTESGSPGFRKTVYAGAPDRSHDRRNARSRTVVATHDGGGMRSLVPERRSGGSGSGVRQVLQNADRYRARENDISIKVEPRKCVQQLIACPERCSLGWDREVDHLDEMTRVSDNRNGVVLATIADNSHLQLGGIDAVEQAVQASGNHRAFVMSRYQNGSDSALGRHSQDRAQVPQWAERSGFCGDEACVIPRTFIDAPLASDQGVNPDLLDCTNDTGFPRR
ncbi:hypothetical protein D806_058360 [Mycolicibacterium smegmatis MKD8]|uniref:Uncharacterized protein n=1 Tax=Mycolicibacterium smegmatis (strain MKD8) TaxID=1214915 RepID=A0A2U9PYA0_MYCSE|nr:hypothetical protein D806_058360 [Mycolicibacterium smegmatis MKD8]